MARKPNVRCNESKQRWMAWVRFPDGTRRKVERVEKADAQADLDELLALRAQEQAPDPRRTKQLTFNVVDRLMCGLRPGELAGLRWPFVVIDSDEPT